MKIIIEHLRKAKERLTAKEFEMPESETGEEDCRLLREAASLASDMAQVFLGSPLVIARMKNGRNKEEK